MTSFSNCARRLAIIALATAGLAACANGGGGGGGGGVAAVPAVAPATTGGKALTVFIPAGNALAVQSRSTGDISVTETGNTASATVDGIPALGTMNRDTSVAASSPVQTYSDNDSSLLVSRVAGNDVLSDASYGLVVQQGTSGGAHIGGFHHGTQTATSEMPSTASATYTGTFGGIAFAGRDGETEGLALVGDTTITANFGAGTVSGNVNNVVTDDGDGETIDVPIGLSMTGNISGNTYTGTTAFTDVNGNALGSVTSSALDGGFYGTNAAETAGAVRIEGSVPEDGAGGGEALDVTITGAFGANR